MARQIPGEDCSRVVVDGAPTGDEPVQGEFGDAALSALRSEVAAVRDLREQVDALDWEVRDFTRRLRLLEALVERQRRSQTGHRSSR